MLDERFSKYMIGNTPLVREWSGALWAEGPAWNGVGRYVVFSDIPNNVQMRWDEATGKVTQLRAPSNFSNGNTFDWQGRQISCEHQTARVVRYEYQGEPTILAVDLRGQAAQRAERRDRPSERRRHPLHGSRLRQPLVLRRHRSRARAADERLPYRSPERASHEADRRDHEAERSVLLARLSHPLRRRYGADASSAARRRRSSAGTFRTTAAASRTGASSPSSMRAFMTASAPTSTATCGARQVLAAKVSTACMSTRPTARRSGKS